MAAGARQFYATPVCATTRAALLTGRYPFRQWMDWRSEDFGKPDYLELLGMELPHLPDGTATRSVMGLNTDERTLADALKGAGYWTALFGKWHLGEWLPEHLPMARGFDQQYGFYGWGIDYNNYCIPHNAPAVFAVYDWHRNQQPLFEQGYSTDLIANETVRLLAQRPKDKPFFHLVAFNAIHGPLEEIPRHRDKFDIVAKMKARLEEVAAERPPLGELPVLMDPALPYIYGRDENASAPEWVKRHVEAVRAEQPQSWPPGTTPWPQAPKGGKIIYTGDGR